MSDWAGLGASDTSRPPPTQAEVDAYHKRMQELRDEIERENGERNESD